MKALRLLLLAGLAISALGARAGGAIDMDAAEKLFTRNVHPFLRRNCAECHSETSTYPHEVEHSHSNPKIAFLNFNRFLDWEKPEMSRAVRMAMSQHFCKLHGYNCDKAAAVAAEADQLFRRFILDTRLASQHVAGPDEGGGASGEANGETGQSVALFNDRPIKMSGDKAEWQTLLFKDAAGRPVGVRLHFARVQDDYFRLEASEIVGRTGFYRVKGVRLRINGRPSTAATGLEAVDRTVVFYSGAHILTAPPAISVVLSNAKPIVRLAPDTVLGLQFDIFQPVESFPARYCDREDRWQRFIMYKLRDMLGTQGHPYWKHDNYSYGLDDLRMLCYELESRLDLVNHRRSLLFYEFARAGQSDVLRSVEGELQEIFRAVTE